MCYQSFSNRIVHFYTKGPSCSWRAGSLLWSAYPRFVFSGWTSAYFFAQKVASHQMSRGYHWSAHERRADRLEDRAALMKRIGWGRWGIEMQVVVSAYGL